MPFSKSEKVRRSAARLRKAAYRARMAPAEDARERAAAAVAIALRLAAVLPPAPPAPLSPAARAAPGLWVSVLEQFGTAYYCAAASASAAGCNAAELEAHGVMIMCATHFADAARDFVDLLRVRTARMAFAKRRPHDGVLLSRAKCIGARDINTPTNHLVLSARYAARAHLGHAVGWDASPPHTMWASTLSVRRATRAYERCGRVVWGTWRAGGGPRCVRRSALSALTRACALARCVAPGSQKLHPRLALAAGGALYPPERGRALAAPRGSSLSYTRGRYLCSAVSWGAA
jgi:hypothetical protein